MRYIIWILLTFSSIAQAQKNETQYFYKLTNDSTKELNKIKEFNDNEILIKEILFKPSNTTYKATYEYYNDGEPKSNIIFYDSLEQVGVKNVFKRSKDNIQYQKTFNIINGKATEKKKIKIINLVDEKGNNIQTITEIDNSKGLVINEFNSNNQITNRLVILDSDTISRLKYHYNKNRQLEAKELTLPAFNSIKCQKYFYDNQSRLATRIILQNSDTMRIDFYKYKGTKLDSIYVNDLKNREEYKIVIEYKKPTPNIL